MVFKKIRLFFLIAKVFIHRQKKVIAISFLAAICLFLLVFSILPSIPKPKQTMRIGLIGSYRFSELPESLLSKVSIGLTRIDQSGSALPALAASWNVSEDAKTYEFTLLDEIFWQDGTAVKAAEIDYNLPGVEQKEIGDKKISFRLKEPFAPFLNLLSEPVFKNGTIGTGKYTIKKLVKQGDFVQKININGPEQNYWYIFYPTQNMAIKAFKLGEIDQIQNLTSEGFPSSWLDFLTVEKKLEQDKYIGIFLNMRNEKLSNKDLRQALAYATPKPDDNSRAYGPLNPASWAYNNDVKKYLSDANQAKKLFKKYQDETKTDKVSLKILTTSNLSFVADQVEKSWKDVLGINTEVSFVDRVPSDFQVLIMVSQIPSDPDQYSFWHSTQDSNLTGYNSPKVDKILEDARKLTNKDKRREKYLDFQKFLLEDCPVVFLSHPDSYTLTRKKLLFTFQTPN